MFDYFVNELVFLHLFLIIIIFIFFSMSEFQRTSNMIHNYSISYPEKVDRRYIFQIKVNWLSIVTLISVLVTFVFCVLWTILFKLEDATSTHCGYRVCLYFN